MGKNFPAFSAVGKHDEFDFDAKEAARG